MRLLLDTCVLVWIALEPERISARQRPLFEDPDHDLAFSVAALWEIAMKEGTKRSLNLDPRIFRQRLLSNRYEELAITAEHTLALTRLPRIHGDPFDRILLAQAQVEDRLLATGDGRLLAYPGVRTLAV